MDKRDEFKDFEDLRNVARSKTSHLGENRPVVLFPPQTQQLCNRYFFRRP